MAGSAHCSAAERKCFFREKAGRLFEHREAGEFLPAPKKVFARGQPRLWRGKPEAKLSRLRRDSFGTFLAAKKSTRLNRIREIPFKSTAVKTIRFRYRYR
ncbi:hypothetical protein [Desulfosudis oleivorans]|uniref:hypothetical protein n=1 Tax=Desulfosudis oleivorans TaxID=181663 RepID=UPI0012946D7F|nr:hypothetical protein [Desulfosudis oleivorans]